MQKCSVSKRVCKTLNTSTKPSKSYFKYNSTNFFPNLGRYHNNHTFDFPHCNYTNPPQTFLKILQKALPKIRISLAESPTNLSPNSLDLIYTRAQPNSADPHGVEFPRVARPFCVFINAPGHFIFAAARFTRAPRSIVAA